MTRRRGATPARAPTLPVALLRAAVERELVETSLRRAAGEIGISPNALRNFLRGAEPRRPTRAKLERWLAARPPADAGPTVHRFVRLLSEVAPDLSGDEAAQLGREVSRSLLDAYGRQRMPPPRWVRELARHYELHGR